jgi:flavin reductase (DIM6/NTAB) family NADH-FMN oxidoreductase RutF
MQSPLVLKKRFRATPQWLPISLQPPQDAVEVRLVTPERIFDVTANNAVAALDPFTIVVGLEPQMRSAVTCASAPELHLVDRSLQRVIGRLRLGPAICWDSTGALLASFHVRHGSHRCAPWPRRAWDGLLYRRASGRDHRPGNFALTATEVQQVMIFYMCPRPVFLVSVDDGQHSNIFPMDLVGPLATDRFTLALRNSSPSVETIANARKVALASVPATQYEIALQLGAHHRKSTIDWSALSFEVRRSQEFALPTMATALRVREIAIGDFKRVGSHTLFVGRVVSDETLDDRPQLFHTCGAYQSLRTRHERPFQAASACAIP